VVLEVHDNRLLPLASRAYTFDTRVPERADGLTLTVRVRYHILTDGQHEMLTTKYGLTGDDPYRFVIYERTLPLSGELTAALDRESRDPQMACAVDGAKRSLYNKAG
jgi:hypothetical protein